jgi:hypothetical protein
VASWTLSPNTYPDIGFFLTAGFSEGSCAIASGYIVCVGGSNSVGTADQVNYAAIGSPGVGTWSASSNYPTYISDESCVTDSGYIYCVGGFNPYLTMSPYTTSNVEYGQVTGSGVSWSSTTSYPAAVDGESCAVYSGYIYCVAGNAGNAVYYAQLSSTGGIVGAWGTGTSYPLISGSGVTNLSCVTDSGYIYCMDGGISSGSTADAYYAPVSSSGVGSWTQATSPTYGLWGLSCVDPSSYVYCIGGTNTLGGNDNVVQYAQVQVASSTSSSSSTTSTSSSSTSTNSSTSTTSSTTTSSSTSTSSQSVPVCPSTAGGALMPVGATFTDTFGNVWLAPSGMLGGGTLSSYFFPGPQSNIPPPMQGGGAATTAPTTASRAG